MTCTGPTVMRWIPAVGLAELPGDLFGGMASFLYVGPFVSGLRALSDSHKRWISLRGSGQVLSPIFIHSNCRTGGTALLAALRRDPAVCVFHDPFNLALTLPWSQIETHDPTAWPSGHAVDMGTYFAEYAPLVDHDRVCGASDDYSWSYCMKADDEDIGQEQYISSLIDLASSQNQVAIIKFEQTEGRVAWLRRCFPNAIHVGLLRDREAQFRSWMALLVIHNVAGFFEVTHRLVRDNSTFFGAEGVADSIDLASWDELRCLFDVFYDATTCVRLTATDVVFDLSPESPESVDDQAQRAYGLPEHAARALTAALRTTRASVPRESGLTLGDLRRMHGVVMPVRMENTTLRTRCDQLSSEMGATWAELTSLVAHRDELTNALRDAEHRLSGAVEALATANEDIATARESLLEATSSKSWRMTEPLRRMSRFPRGS